MSGVKQSTVTFVRWQAEMAMTRRARVCRLKIGGVHLKIIEKCCNTRLLIPGKQGNYFECKVPQSQGPEQWGHETMLKMDLSLMGRRITTMPIVPINGSVHMWGLSLTTGSCSMLVSTSHAMCRSLCFDPNPLKPRGLLCLFPAYATVDSQGHVTVG